MRKNVWIIILFSWLFFINSVSAQVTNITVTITNLPPYVGPISVTDPVKFFGNVTSRAWCNATVSDMNGYDDIKIISSVVWNPQTSTEYSDNNPYNHYAPAYTLYQVVNGTSKNVMNSFTMESSSRMGIWTCKIKAIDSNLTIGENSKNITVYSEQCSNNVLDYGELMVDCGGICPPCLSANDIFIQVRPGKSKTGLTTVSSGSSQNIRIKDISKTSLFSDKGIIDLSNVRLEPYSFILNPYSSQEVYVIVYVPEWTETGVYSGKLTFTTNITLSLEINVTVDTRRRGIGYIDLDISGKCLNDIINITAIDERHYGPLENATVIIEYNWTRMLITKTNASGIIQFIPPQEGTYRITVSKEGFSSESAFVHVTQCGISQTCYNGIRDGDETDIDCGGSCPPCYCSNGIKDPGEEDIDCGGSCPPCHCSDGIKDVDETGIDCGGSCPLCPKINYIPKLLIISQDEVTVGNNISVYVVDDDNNSVYAVIMATKPNGDKIKKTTDSKGYVPIDTDVMGRWELVAVKSGYIPNIKYVNVTEAFLTTVVKVTSYTLLAIILLLILYQRRKRTKIVVDDSSLQRLIEEDALRKYKNIYVTLETYHKFSDIVPKEVMKAVSLSENDIERADELSRDLGITVEEAKVLVISEKLRALRSITYKLPAEMEEFKGTKIVTVEQELT